MILKFWHFSKDYSSNQWSFTTRYFIAYNHVLPDWRVEQPSCRKRQLMGQFPDLWYRLALGRASGCKNFCLKKASRKWGTSCHPRWRGQDWVKIGWLLHLRNRNIEKCFWQLVSKYQACYCRVTVYFNIVFVYF